MSYETNDLTEDGSEPVEIEWQFDALDLDRVGRRPVSVVAGSRHLVKGTADPNRVLPVLSGMRRRSISSSSGLPLGVLWASVARVTVLREVLEKREFARTRR